MHFLGIDAGASATKWALICSEEVVASGIEEAMDGHIYRESSKKRMDQVLKKIADSTRGIAISGAYLGITGVLHDGSIEQALIKAFNASNTVVSDIELAYRANFSQGEGILLYAGTGSVAFAIDERNQIQQIGGWGYLLGDEGAGFWIGRESIRHSLSLIESKQEIAAQSLAGLILAEIAAHDWNSVKTFVYSQERSAIAALSKIVDGAAQKGDQNAIEILRRAANHLADLIHRIDKNLTRKALPVKFTGGISGSHTLYSELEKFLRMRVSISTVDIARRAAELAAAGSL